MKNKTKLNILLIFLLLLNSSYLINVKKGGTFATSSSYQEQVSTISLSYTPQAPIEISDNSGLSSYSASGNGSVDNPYIISGFNITTTNSYAIYIHGSSVTAYFGIENCYFNSAQYGIHIDGIGDNIASIGNNTFENCTSAAIFVDSTNNFVIKGNKIIDSGTAVLIEAAEEFTIEENAISNCSSGIFANYYEGVLVDMNITATIFNNTIETITGSAIKINKHQGTATIFDSIFISENTISNVSRGIYVLRSPNVIVENNKLCNTTDYAIELYSYYIYSDSSNYSVKNNVITGTNMGISLEYNINNAIVEGNNITDANIAINAGNPLNLTIRNNVIEQNSKQNIAINLYNVNNVSVADNDVFNGTIKIDGSSEVEITNNRIIKSSKNIDIFESENVTIFNNELGDNSEATGIDIYAIINLNISCNNLTNLGRGIELYADNSRLIQNISIGMNYFNQIDYGVYIGSGRIVENLTIEENTFTAIEHSAIYMFNGGTGLKIVNNTISSRSNAAIRLYLNWIDMIISENTIIIYSSEYTGSGIHLGGGVVGGRITNNTFIEDTHNEKEMFTFLYLESGVSNMVIYYNQFFSKSSLEKQSSVKLVYDYGSANLWYNTTTNIGNYYCDYSGSGSYSITGDALSEDLYPITYVDTDNDGLDDYLELYLGTNPIVLDTDLDGMPDGWEIYYGFDPLANDGLEDQDNDGLTNLGEFLNNCDPTNSDTDGDLIPDGYEVDNDLNPLVNDATEDKDGDGIDNFTEYIDGTKANDADSDDDGWTDKQEKDAGTDPLDPNSHPEETTTPNKTSYFYLFGLIGIVAITVFLKKKYRN
ncbi:MAG: right-handed parallel beta-helix repeat-containing protein [Candidatus Heimdallarchaeaceae archaeon]